METGPEFVMPCGQASDLLAFTLTRLEILGRSDTRHCAQERPSHGFMSQTKRLWLCWVLQTAVERLYISLGILQGCAQGPGGTATTVMVPREWTATQVHTWELIGVSPVTCLPGTTSRGWSRPTRTRQRLEGSQVSLADSIVPPPHTLCQSQGMVAHLNLSFRQGLAKLPSQALYVVFLSKNVQSHPATATKYLCTAQSMVTKVPRATPHSKESSNVRWLHCLFPSDWSTNPAYAFTQRTLLTIALNSECSY